MNTNNYLEVLEAFDNEGLEVGYVYECGVLVGFSTDYEPTDFNLGFFDGGLSKRTGERPFLLEAPPEEYMEGFVQGYTTIQGKNG